MKIKYFIRLYLSHMLFLINITLLINAHYKFIFVVLLMYGVLFYQLNKKGFISRLNYLYIVGINALLIFFTHINITNIVLVLGTILCELVSIHSYLPIRNRIRKLYAKIDKDKHVTIFHNRIEQEGSIIDVREDFRQIEIEWLCHRILLESVTLTRIEESYLDNEIFGQHIKVNIV